MIRLILTLLFSGYILVASAQQSDPQLTESTRDAFNRNGMAVGVNNTNLAFFGIKGAKGDVVGNSYMDSTWLPGTIKLYKKIGPPGREGDSISNVPLRLDLYTNELEVKAAGVKEVRGINGAMIRFFTLELPERRLFLNVKEFRTEDNLQGFVELIKAGRLSLVEHTKLSVIKPNYNEAIGLGSKDTKIVKSGQYYVVKGNTLLPIGTSKKKLLDAMADRADDVEAFIKTNKLSLKSREDMTKVFAYYNNL